MKITVADVDNMQDESFKLHRANGRQDYLFVLFKSPSKVMVDGEYIDTDYGSFIIFDKHKIQSYYACNNEKFVHDFIHFDLDSDYEKLIFSEIPKGKLLQTSLPSAISSILSEIKDELNSSFIKYKTETLTNLGTVFLYRIKRELENSRLSGVNRSYYPELYNLRLNIYHNPQMSWSIESMSQEVCLSRSYFQYLYKSFFSVSCNEDIINARIAHAKMLLSTGYLSINEIAEKCGYRSTEHFIRQFKDRTGVSPKKFRNK